MQDKEAMFRPANVRSTRGRGLATVIASALSLGIASGPGCSSEAEVRASGPPEIPLVLLISIDCARADHFSCYGYDIETTPAVDLLAQDGIRFERCYSQCNWTKPSVASLFTGQHVRGHGVTVGSQALNAIGEFERVDKSLGAYPLPSDIPLLAESMRARGYRTVGVVENTHISAVQGFGRGFDQYTVAKPALPTTLVQFEGVVNATAPQALYSYVHFIGPHDPYDNDLSPHKDKGNAKAFARYRARLATFDSQIDFTRFDYKKQKALSEQDLRQARALYDTELAYFDGEYVGPLLDWLREEGLYDEALIVLTADHGEELGEHGSWAHGHALHESLIHIPLIIKLPASVDGLPAGSAVSELVESIDLFPTLCEFVGAPVPRECHGESLRSLLLGKREVDPNAIAVSEHAKGSSKQVLAATVIQGNEKYLTRYEGETIRPLVLNVEGDKALFDLSTDAMERKDLKEQDPDRVREMLKLLEGRVGSSPRLFRQQGEMILLDAEEVDDLRSLGYIGEEE
ncbi:MAG: arylsulfatase A-like enzyme [Planctomycetota bacterium]|jgi:arylsulfatase A-like enzyme